MSQIAVVGHEASAHEDWEGAVQHVATATATPREAVWFRDTDDGGPIAAQDWCHIRHDDDALSLWVRELAPMGLRLFRQVLADLERGRVVRIEQDAALASWEPAMEGAPRLFRPDLEMLGLGDESFQVIRERHA